MTLSTMLRSRDWTDWVSRMLPRAVGRSHYRLPASFYMALLLRLSIVKTTWYSLRFKGVVLVGRGSHLRIHRTAEIRLSPGGLLAVGLAHDAPGGSVLRMKPRSQFHVDGRVQIMRTCTVSVGYDATLRIGDGTFLNDGAAIICEQEVRIGPDCAISWNVRIMDSDIHQLRTAIGMRARRCPVSIGEHCWIGTGATLLKGTDLADGVVVGAGSLIRGSAAGNSLVVGVPGKVIAQEVSWEH